MIGLNRRRMMGGEKLPYDAEIEYLETTGTQWIDTGINGNSIYGVELIYISDIPIADFDSILSCKLDDFTLAFYLARRDNNNRMYLRLRGKEIFNDVRIEQSSEQHFLITDNKATFNGRTYNIDTPIAKNSKNLFIANNSDYSRPAHAKYKRLKLYYQNDVLIRDFIPVRVGTTGYMYDKVSGQLFGNAGTGSFILGPDVTSGGNS